MPGNQARSRARSAATRGPARVPRAPKALVPRQRLYRNLDTATESPLTLIVGPAGTGKTVLLSSWLEQASTQVGQVRWKSAHDGVDVAEILLLAAGVESRRAHTLLADSPPGDSMPAVLDELRNCAEGDNPPDLVVVDDAHLLGSREIGLLSAVLSSGPDSVRLLLASRRDLPLPILELQLHGHASVIRAGELRFDEQESEQLVRHHFDTATADAVDQLRARADGWAAALVLGARALAAMDGTDPTRSPLGRTEEPIVDFLLGEAFDSLVEPVRELLLSTSEEPHVTASKAETLTGRPDAGILLSRLAADGLLVTAYADGSSHELVYAYHPLLVELLRRKTAADTDNRSTISSAHQRAALAYAGSGDVESALRHATAARNEDLIARFIFEHGPALLASGGKDSITRAYAVLPDDVLDRRPSLTGVAGLYRRIIGDTADAVVLAARAAEIAQTMVGQSVADSIVRDAVHADAMILQLWQTHFGWRDLHTTIAEARAALGCLPSPLHEHRPTLVLSPERQSWLSLELASAEIWAGDLAEASVHVDVALLGARAADNGGLTASALGQRALLELIHGNARLAADSAHESLEHADRLQPECVHAQSAYLVLAWVSYINLDFPAAGQWLGRMDTSQVRGQSTAVVSLMLRNLLQSALLVESGEAEQAQRVLSDPVGGHSGLPEFLICSLAQFRWNAAKTAGDRPTAQAQIELLRARGFTGEADCLMAVELITDGEIDAAMGCAERALSVDGASELSTRATAAVVRTAALLLKGSREEARLSLLDALTRTAPQELLYLLSAGLIAGPAFLDLLAEESRRIGAHPYAATAQTALGKYLSDRQATFNLPDHAEATESQTGEGRQAAVTTPTRQSTQVAVNGVRVTLTERELDVLEQLALGSSYHEIGLALYITENTVKTHLASLYRKLGVERKSAALRVARELGLL